MKQYWIDFWLIIGKNAALIIGVTSTMTAKLIIENRSKRLTFWEVVGKVIIGGACGWVTCSYLLAHNMGDTAKWATPMATMAGESILLWLGGNAPKLIKFAVKKIFGVKEEDLK